MIKVNLVPAEILAKAHQKQQVLQAAVVGALVVLLVVAVSLAHVLKLNRLEAQLTKDQADLKKLEVVVTKVEEIERTAGAVRARLDVVNNLLKARMIYPYFMSDFVRNVPLGVRVKSLTTSGGGSTVGPIKLSMSAESRTNEDIAAWVRRMEESGRFSAVELGAVTTAEGADKVYLFTVTTVYTPAL